MKKVIALLLALLMVTFVFAACGENKPAETKAEATEKTAAKTVTITVDRSDANRY